MPPLLTGKGFLLALGMSLLMCWPMLINQSYFGYFDTISYIDGGRQIWQIAWNTVGALLPDIGGSSSPGMGGVAASAESTEPETPPLGIRSPLYPLYTYLAGAAIWPAGFAVLQSALVLWTLFALVPREAIASSRILITGVILVGVFSSLPWFTVYLMPDLAAAAVILYAAVLLRTWDRIGSWQRAGLIAIACFAVAAHYGHSPLALGLLVGVWVWRMLSGRLSRSLHIAVLLPLVFAPLFNLTASTAALDKPSVAPLRMPILLARSIQDGPAKWYLREVCPDAPLAFCEAFGEDVPGSIPDFLWREDGIVSLSPEIVSRIREEEALVLWQAFRAYPVEQIWSLSSNFVAQIFKIGTDGIIPAHRNSGNLLTLDDGSNPLVDSFDDIVPVVTWLGTLVIAGLLVSGRLSRQQIEVIGVVVAGLLLNALIFGGLSAPVDRYQARVAWLLPALAVIYAAVAVNRARSAQTVS